MMVLYALGPVIVWRGRKSDLRGGHNLALIYSAGLIPDIGSKPPTTITSTVARQLF